MSDDDLNPDETGFDRILQFTLTDRNARGRIVRLGPCSRISSKRTIIRRWRASC